MLNGLVIALHVIVSVALIATVLLQSGKSAGLGTIGGGAEQIFGRTKGLDEFLGKLSAVIAGAFMVTAVLLTILHG